MYLDKTLLACVACPIGCITCISFATCLSCSPNYSIQNNLCRCAAGYGSDPTTNLCVLCSDTKCSNCYEDYTKCTKCSGYYIGLDKINHTCIPCADPNCYICRLDYTKC